MAQEAPKSAQIALCNNKSAKLSRNYFLLIQFIHYPFSANSCSQLISSPHVPRWLQVLLTEKFYNACVIHEGAKKNEKNVYCLDCSISLCPHCLSPHRSHRLLQIRRYVYHDVIRLDDAQKLVDCTSVQSYTTNSAKVVFLNQRPQTRNFRGSSNFCNTCDRSLQYPYQFCSLSCKINYLVATTGSVSGYLFECNYLSLPETGFDDFLMNPGSVLDSDIVRKKRSGGSAYRPACRPVCEISAGLMNRRKGTPQRAPLY
ncbi:protein RGF1 INDUCIBLE TRANSCRIPTION FACTOR 1 [Gastrolobium bilobum]|uniref:protein RGF1 INDUCIBLE TRANSCRIPTION FACTOR 1 n=1 Tax=Gastrolobium bilobum TaxID=150636 RepID=UPI002AB138B5|nr:protein RGF1 INDUCIBLE TRANSCRIPTION FACTOR 1 [Gastrolobium bilobum]